VSRAGREQRWVAKLQGQYVRFALEYWEGKLPTLPIRVSWRMRTRVAQLEWTRVALQPVEISINGRDILRFGWKAVREALLHEMVHVWQCRHGIAPSHGTLFQAEATRIGISPEATERLRPLRRRRGSSP